MSIAKKKVVILFGSGAAIPWKAPSTFDLTSSIIKSSAPDFVCSDGQTKVTEYIYNALAKCYPKEDINFETIINIIEELIVHYSYFDNKRELPSLSKILFSSKFGNDILNFSIKGKVKKHGYYLEIPKDTEYNFSNPSLNSESPEQFYFQHLLAEILTDICAEIPQYEYHSNQRSVIFTPNNNERNENFQKWIKKIADASVVRMYTLNYDRLFKVLSIRAGIEVFEGFECDEYIPQHGLKPNVQRILSDFTSNIHYNLHGSSNWEVHSLDEYSQLQNPWISLQPYPIFEINSTQNAILQIEKGKSILVSNIITGFQKAQKSFITPFKQMQASFDSDCSYANEMFVIGYSFGDAHINASIKTALKYNPNLKLHFIDPAYCEKDGKKGYELLCERLIYIFPEIFSTKRTNPIYSDDKDTCTYYNNLLKVTATGFEEYLSKEL
jgi:hypothetical protein